MAKAKILRDFLGNFFIAEPLIYVCTQEYSQKGCLSNDNSGNIT